MKSWLVPYCSSLLLMLAIDGAWLAATAKRFYGARLGPLMAETPSLAPAGLFYLIYALALTALVVVPATENGSGLAKTFLTGALLGLAAYGTYDLTNQSVMNGWPAIVTIVDLAWGTLLTGTVAAAATQIARRWL